MAETADLESKSKSELVEAADEAGVEVSSSDTKADLIAKIRAGEGDAPEAQAAPEVREVVINPNREIDNFNARSDNDAFLGSFVDVVDGEHQGVFGHYVQTVEWDESDGYPTVALVRTRDAQAELIPVAYSNLRNSVRAGGR